MMLTLSLIEWFLLNLPLMKASAAKEKDRQLTRSRLAHRASGPTLSYPKTRVRASRLSQAAFILAIVELTRRLHQAYGFAYDKQAADWVLPQNLAPLPNRQNTNLTKATNALASKLASGVSEDCQKNVIDKLKSIGFDLNGFISFLGNNPRFYNGVTSQALAAGTVSPKQPADILYGPGATIADVFKGSGNTRPSALTSITSPTFLSFFRPDAISGSGAGTQSLIFHEGIHGFTGKVDADVQNALGIKETPVSQNITDYIRKHCF